MAVITTDDSSISLKACGVDRLGITTNLENINFTTDQPALTTLAPDPNNPGAILLSRNTVTDPNAGALTVNVTATNADTGNAVTQSFVFNPGKEFSMVIESTIVPLDAVPVATPAATPETTPVSNETAAVTLPESVPTGPVNELSESVPADPATESTLPPA